MGVTWNVARMAMIARALAVLRSAVTAAPFPMTRRQLQANVVNCVPPQTAVDAGPTVSRRACAGAGARACTQTRSILTPFFLSPSTTFFFENVLRSLYRILKL